MAASNPAVGGGASRPALVGAGADVIARGFVLRMAGIPISVFLGWRGAVHAAGEPPAPATTTARTVAA